MGFLRNAWYVAAWSDEIGRAPLSRRILGDAVALFRREDGGIDAIGDVCPHRFASLSRGMLIGDTLECPYHGLRFDGAGKCVLNPHGDGRITPRLAVPSYAVVERYGLAWIWMGDAQGCDAGLIPDFSHLEDPARTHVRPPQLVVQAHYELVIDNLMDLSHLLYVHSGTAGLKGFEQCVHASAPRADGAIVSEYAYLRGRSELAAHLGDRDMIVDSWFDMAWHAPSNLLLHTGVTRAGADRGAGASTLGSHLLTPESETSTRYFICNSRSFASGDAAVDESIRNWQENALRLEDKVVLEDVQRNMGTSDLLSLEPALLDNDKGGMLVRRRLAKLIRDEERSTARTAAVSAEMNSPEAALSAHHELGAGSPGL